MTPRIALTRRTFVSTGAVAALAACARSAPPAWTMPPGVMDLPGAKLWNAPPAGAHAPLDAPLLTTSGRATLGALIGNCPALLSFWAPWCAPCLAEKPSLDALSQRLAEAHVGLKVISILAFVEEGEQTAAAVREAQARLGVTHLAPIADASSRALSPFRAYVDFIEGGPLAVGGANPSLPCSTLIAPDGAEIGRMASAILFTPPQGMTPAEIAASNPADVMAHWPKRELWRDDAMFEFLKALSA